MESTRDARSGDGSAGSGTTPSSLLGGVRKLTAGLANRRRRISQAGLVAALNEMAEAVSSATSTEEALTGIVERAKQFTDTDKAVLVLADEHDGLLDLDTIVVRGSRAVHPQDWWQLRLEHLGDRVWANSGSELEYHDEEAAWLLWSPIRVRDHPIGVLCAINSSDRPFTDEHVDYLAVLSAFAGSSIENARLAEQSRYVLLASERDRIAREMHDGVVQSLFSISLGLELCKKQIIRDAPGVIDRLDELQGQLNTAMTELRRFIYDLRPVKLTELGLAGAIDYWIAEVTMGRRVRGRLVVDGTGRRLTPSEEACLYRIAKESVSNVVKHADAEHFVVKLRYTPERVRLVVTDDGNGFDPVEAVNAGGVGIGLHSIRDRVSRAGGTLRVESAPGAGTTVTVELMLGGSDAQDQRSDS